MHPILIKVGRLTIYSYGFFLALAFLIGFFLIRSELRRKGLKQEIAYDLVILAIIGGIIGARIAYVLGDLDYFIKKPLAIIGLGGEGLAGLVFLGGLIGGILFVLIYLLWNKLPVWKVADIAAPALAMGAAIGRIGCFFNGCCYGTVTTLPIGVNFFDVPRHPTQIYDAAYNLLIFAILWGIRDRVEKDGFLFWLYLLLYSTFRFLIEFIRVNPDFIWILSRTQIATIFIFFLAIFVLFKVYRFSYHK
jgi:phosphatidylglycerol:prolipoprotein diacylglycerol transferase